MKKYRKNIVLIFVILGIVLYFSLRNDLLAVLNKLYSVNLWWFLIACILMLVYFVLRTFELQKIVNLTEKNYSFQSSFFIVFLGQFFANITPSSIGAQPFQIYYLSKDGVEGGQSTRSIVQYNMVYQIAFILLSLFSLSIAIFGFVDFNSSFMKLAIIGFSIHFSVLLFLLGASFFKKTNEKIIFKIIKIMEKLKLVKNKEQQINKWNSYISNFHKGSSLLFKRPCFFIRSVLVSGLSIIAMYLIPAVLVLSLGYNNIGLLDSILSSNYTNIIGAFLPSPGGAGGFEYFFIQFFGVFLAGSTLTSLMLLWRFITYYLVVFGGFLLMFFKKERNVLE